MSYSEAWQLSPIEREFLIKTLNRYNKAKNGDKSAPSDEWIGDDL